MPSCSLTKELRKAESKLTTQLALKKPTSHTQSHQSLEILYRLRGIKKLPQPSPSVTWSHWALSYLIQKEAAQMGHTRTQRITTCLLTTTLWKDVFCAITHLAISGNVLLILFNVFFIIEEFWRRKNGRRILLILTLCKKTTDQTLSSCKTGSTNTLNASLPKSTWHTHQQSQQWNRKSELVIHQKRFHTSLKWGEIALKTHIDISVVSSGH